jgi:RNA polymerase sigma-70 factor, ECF subfamily
MPHPPLSDEALLAQALAGSQEAFAALYRRHQGRVFRFARVVSGSDAVAEEAAQETFLALLDGRARFDSGKGTLAAFLLGVARNFALRGRHAAQPAEAETEIAAEEATPLERLLRAESVDRLWKAIESLPAPYREALVLCELEELDYAQAAQAMGCAIGTVRSRLYRARALVLEKVVRLPA